MKEHRVYDPGEELAVADELFRAVLLLDTLDECRAFFQDLCTPAELQAMKDRWRVAELLAAGLTYRDIRAKTGVSVATVGRVARCLNEPPAGYAAVLKKMDKTV
ncbi:MAG: YerC/YecD family TrpR-related protein [Gammaproteobacteria bacterium]|jgi:TrpR-related protein YerC/YecD|nr:YerC/YecD family TrpR-related protein [Gammaproteobacteria bacterium]